MIELRYEDLVDKNIIPEECLIFNCVCCKLNELPKLPSKLVRLESKGNYLTWLPELPSSLVLLFCTSNNIIELPKLPKKLKVLYISDNNLSELPELPYELNNIDCSNNPIKFITPENYEIMKRIYLKCCDYVWIENTIFYDNSGCYDRKEFFKIEK
jgi:hypothetical protein